MSELNTQTPADLYAETVHAGIVKAKENSLQAALSNEVLQALASLKSTPDTLGTYLTLLNNLVSSNKAIRKGDVEKAINTYLPDEGKETGSRVSAADEIVALVTNACTLFTDQEDEGFAAIEQDGHREVWPVNSSTFKDWVSMLMYRTAGKTPRAASLADAFSTLNGIARHDGETHNVYLRVAVDGADGYYLDIGDDEWRAIQITRNSWQIINEPPVRFRRTKGAKAIPIPQKGGTLADLKSLVNISDEDDFLLVAVLIECLRPDTADPVIELIGGQGSGKSATAENIRRLIDPKSVNLRSAPKTVEDLFIGARNNHVVCLNNLSRLSGAEQDALCNLSTGGGYASRKLYTNDDEVTYEAKRPVLINGINAVATQPDLVSRVIRLECPSLETNNKKRLDDKSLAALFDERAPLAMGFILDTMVEALAVLPDIELTDRPRLMDFTRLGAAVGRVLNPKGGEQYFTTRYRDAREAASLQALDSMPVIVSLVDYLESYAPYTGSYADLLKNIENKIGKTADSAWPKSAKGLASAIGRAKPVLNLLGWEAIPASRDKRGARVTVRKSAVSEIVNNKDSKYTTYTKYINERCGVDSVDGADRSAINCNHPMNKKKDESELPNSTGNNGYTGDYLLEKTGSTGGIL